MDRSLAGRALIGRSFDPAAPFAKALGLARAGLSRLAGHRRLRLGLLAMLLAVPALAGGWLLLRNSSLVSVERVHISGVHGAEAAEVEAALTRAARHMSTLDVRTGALDAAVAPYRVVAEVRATPSFPHGLQIHVIEQLPVAALTVAGGRTAVAADGVVLGPALLSSSLPLLNEGSSASAVAVPVGRRVKSSSLLSSLTLLGAAPAPLARAVASVYEGPQGVTAAMHNGLVVYFGNAVLPHAKWLSLARVLADPSSAGAMYVDVRVPGRPAAGFAGSGPPEAATSASAPASAADPTTAAALAAGLTSALGLSPGEQVAPLEESSTGAKPSEATSGAAAPAGAATQTGSSGAAESASAASPEASATAPSPGG
jgi:cell division protein FtsQ